MWPTPFEKSGASKVENEPKRDSNFNFDPRAEKFLGWAVILAFVALLFMGIIWLGMEAFG
jgi:hypothetical protein